MVSIAQTAGHFANRVKSVRIDRYTGKPLLSEALSTVSLSLWWLMLPDCS